MVLLWLISNILEQSHDDVVNYRGVLGMLCNDSI